MEFVSDLVRCFAKAYSRLAIVIDVRNVPLGKDKFVLTDTLPFVHVVFGFARCSVFTTIDYTSLNAVKKLRSGWIVLKSVWQFVVLRQLVRLRYLAQLDLL